MGWSCRKEAGDTMSKISRAIIERFKNQNTWEVGSRKFFYEHSRVEHDDGAITGSVCEIRFYPPTQDERCFDVGSFRIEGDGTIKKFPHFPKEWLK
jgi:hypothetical protein